MALGAYSIIRYSNNLNDQRVNLGVLVWHPIDGFRKRVTPFLDRAQAVDPRVNVKPLRQQLEILSREIEAPSERGGALLSSLSDCFKEGLEVTTPYPAEMFDVEETLQQLYTALVSPVEEFRRASTQKQFERSFKSALTVALKSIPGVRQHDHGVKRVNGVEVDVGVRTTAGGTRALWRALSLQAEDRADDLMARAKATAMDVRVIRDELSDFRQDRQIVALQAPKPRGIPHLATCVSWLKHAVDEVVVLNSGDDIAASLQAAATSVHRRPRGH